MNETSNTWSSHARISDGNALLQVEGLCAEYRKNKPAVCNLSFTVSSGEIVGVIGPNGAGKSTTIKAILGLIKKSEGEVKLPSRLAGGYAYIPELPALYEELTLWEHLEVIAMAHGMEETAFKPRAEALLRQFGMENVQYSFPGGFSKGMRQKAMILCAILIQPELYLVDEPFNGLDPFGLKELLDWFASEKGRGAGILLTTHVLDIAERICDRFVLINNGQKVIEGNLTELQIQADSPGAKLLDVFLRLIRG